MSTVDAGFIEVTGHKNTNKNSAVSAPSVSGKKAYLCMYDGRCWRHGCNYDHRKQNEPIKGPCIYGTDCRNKDCKFRHDGIPGVNEAREVNDTEMNRLPTKEEFGLMGDENAYKDPKAYEGINNLIKKYSDALSEYRWRKHPDVNTRTIYFLARMALGPKKMDSESQYQPAGSDYLAAVTGTTATVTGTTATVTDTTTTVTGTTATVTDTTTTVTGTTATVTGTTATVTGTTTAAVNAQENQLSRHGTSSANSSTHQSIGDLVVQHLSNNNTYLGVTEKIKNLYKNKIEIDQLTSIRHKEEKQRNDDQFNSLLFNLYKLQTECLTNERKQMEETEKVAAAEAAAKVAAAEAAAKVAAAEAAEAAAEAAEAADAAEAAAKAAAEKKKAETTK